MSVWKKAGLMLAAPGSGSGKTVLTLALLRALQNRGVEIAAAKAGPDYIDPGFQAIASGHASVNLDPWAMTKGRVRHLACSQPGTHLLVEAMMGLFDGAADGSGSAAELARILGFPVVLVVDTAKLSHSIAAIVRGFRDHDPELQLAGLILNRVGSARHETLLREALDGLGIPVLGAVRRSAALELPERHLGLVQACDHPEIEAFVAAAGNMIAESVDLDGLLALFSEGTAGPETIDRVAPLGQQIAVASDQAFSFTYAHLISDWQVQGAAVSFFSPLADQPPEMTADAVFLPGGYPELDLAALSDATGFFSGLARARDRGTLIYGECGGYMVLGDGIVDEKGQGHRMAGLLRLETSFEKRKLHLGYRRLETEGFVLGSRLNAHEFHYTRAVAEAGEPLFKASDARGNNLGNAGLRRNNVMGSYMHVIDGEQNE